MRSSVAFAVGAPHGGIGPGIVHRHSRRARVRTISPSIIAIGTPEVSEATLSDTSTAIVAEGKIELTPLDPLNMLPAKADGAARMEELTPRSSPSPRRTPISNEIVAAIEEASRPAIRCRW